MSKVTVVIPAWNKWELTRACLDSLERTTSREVLEILVVDNGSIDSTPGQLEELAGSGRLRFLRNSENRGFAIAVNQGIREAAGDVLLLNNDIVAQPGWLEPLLAELDSPDVSGAGSLLLYPTARWIQHAGVGMGYLKGRLKIWHDYQYRKVDDVPQARGRRDCLALTAACLMLKRSALDRFGGLDEGFRNGYEDVDFCLRVATGGGRLVYRGDSVLIHHESVTTGRHQYEMENRKRFFSRWEGRVESVLSSDEVRRRLDENEFRRGFMNGALTPGKARRLSRIVRARGAEQEAASWMRLAGPLWKFWRRTLPVSEIAKWSGALGYEGMDAIRVVDR